MRRGTAAITRQAAGLYSAFLKSRILEWGEGQRAERRLIRAVHPPGSRSQTAGCIWVTTKCYRWFRLWWQPENRARGAEGFVSRPCDQTLLRVVEAVRISPRGRDVRFISCASAVDETPDSYLWASTRFRAASKTGMSVWVIQ